MRTMRFVMKYGIDKYRIYDENRQLTGTVRKKPSAGNQLTVKCMDNKISYTVIRDVGAIRISGEGMDALYCGLQYTSADGHISEAYWRPPMAVQTDIAVCGGRVSVCQMRNRNFEILLNGKRAGWMKHMMSVSKELHLENDTLNQYSGLIFAVGILMLHDDAIEIV